MEGLSDNGVMTVRAGDTLTLRYEDPMPPGERTATAAVARQGVLQASPAAVVSAVAVTDATALLLRRRRRKQRQRQQQY